MEKRIKLVLEKCKGCKKTRKYRIFIHLTDEVIRQINQYYDLSFTLILCPDCREKILKGIAIGI